MSLIQFTSGHDLNIGVNKQHPLARGLKTWKRALPGRRTGLKVFDLVNRAYDGTITNGNADWFGRGPVNSHGAWNFDGTDDEITQAAVVATTNFTVALAFRATNLSFDYALWDSGSQATALNLALWSGGLLILHDAGVDNFSSANTITAGRWVFGGVSKSGDTGANVTFYVYEPIARFYGADGTASVGTVTTPSGTAKWGRSVTYSDFNGQMNDMMIWDRALSAAEWNQLFAQHRAGWYSLENRARRKWFPGTAAAPAGDAVPQVWSQYRRRHAG